MAANLQDEIFFENQYHIAYLVVALFIAEINLSFVEGVLRQSIKWLATRIETLIAQLFRESPSNRSIQV